MPIFRYKAVTESNEVVEGEMEAPGRAVVVDRLRGLGHLPLDAREIEIGSRSIGSGRSLFSRRRVSNRDVLIITHELATLLKAGLPLDRAVDTLIDLGANEANKQLLTQILAGLRGGMSFANTLAEKADIFPQYYISMVRAGEASGALDLVLERLAVFLEKSEALKESIKTALYYPVFLLGTAVLSLIILLGFVIPEFEPLFEGAGTALPASTSVLVAIGDFIRDYGWLILIGLVAGVLLLRHYLATAAGRQQFDRLLLRMPLIGDLVTKVEVARLSRTTSTLLQNGVGLLNAIVIVRDTLKNSVLAASIDTVAARLKEGRGLAEPLKATGVFPKLVVHLVRVGEETGKLDDMLSKLADIYDEEVNRTTARMLALLVPMLTIGMGVMIAAIIMSILTAIFSVNTLAF